MHWTLENDVDSERREQEKRGIFMPYTHYTSPVNPSELRNVILSRRQQSYLCIDVYLYS